MIMLPISIDTNNIRVTNAVASVINGAFETGINPAWFEVKSLNKGGFLDAAFADGEMETPSKKPATTQWTLEARLNYDSFKSKWVTLTAEEAVKRWVKYAMGGKNGEFGLSNQKVFDFLMYLSMLPKNPDKANDFMMDTYEPDGVHDDFMAQVAIAEDVIFG
jgi:hypothetical protein